MAKDTNNEANSGPQDDPIVGTSLSGPIVISSVLLFLSLVWALYDELGGQRPWKRYQEQFTSLYTSYLNKLGPRQAAAEKAVFASAEFRKIDEELKSAEGQIAPRVKQIDQELGLIRQQLAAIKNPFQDARARIAALTYELDHAADGGPKNGIREDIGEVRKAKFEVAWPADSGKAPAQSNFTFDELEKRFTGLKSREAQLNAEQAAITKNVRELRRKRNDYLTEHLTGLSQQQIDGLQRKMDQFSVEIKQIHIEEAGLVDRCESCHVGIREPVALTAADMGGHRLFVSHPQKSLLTIHDPNRFGCSPCHNGNGLATSSAQKAHGQYTHWLWPLFARENSEAGCLQCHFGDRVLDQAAVLTRGRDLFELRGCVGCHRYEMFDRESDTLTAIRKDVQNLENQQKESRLEMGREIKLGDTADSNTAAQAHYAKAENLRVSASNMEAKIAELDQRSRYLMQDQKKIGPNLKDVRLKLRKEWIPVWLKDPPAFQPGTMMAKFRLSDEEIRTLAAFVCQSSPDGPAPAKQTTCDPAKGK
jgi:hypothetical protein